MKALVLFFLSPMIAELLSGSAPPVEFFNPLGLLVLTALVFLVWLWRRVRRAPQA